MAVRHEVNNLESSVMVQELEFAIILAFITKTCLHNFDPFKPHFYMVKLGFTGVYIIFLLLFKNIDCGYLLEPPRRGGSNEYPQSIFWAEMWKNISFFVFFLSENFQFLEVKVSIYLNRRVSIMFSNTYSKLGEMFPVLHHTSVEQLYFHFLCDHCAHSSHFEISYRLSRC